MKILPIIVLLSSFVLAQSIPTWRWLEYSKDLKLEYSYAPNSKSTFIADVTIQKSERKTSYGAAMLALETKLRDAATQKPEAAGSFNTILFRGLLTNDFIFSGFNELALKVGESKGSFAQTRLTVKSSTTIAGIAAVVVEVEAPDNAGKRVLTSEFTIAPNFPLPLKIRTFSNGKLEQVLELKKVK